MSVNIIKLCVGADGVEDLLDWQASARAKGADGLPRHITRMTPKRRDEVLDGGSLYWVFKGQVLARQRILRLDPVTGEDGINRCAIVLDPEVHRTEPAPRRPFQGWRYLNDADTPRDLPKKRAGDDTLPPGMAEALAEFGLH
ncbi:DUF1489 domain-containing protein [Pararhodobacter sp.]|uniref:DUF1489 family protein n=1 Tax=Pararhodobacter sp. TaxID=2127056 RepID=UPI002AFFBD6B|nr:DUF1489 domain-containing protein [Pararhodobacter sp.]